MISSSAISSDVIIFNCYIIYSIKIDTILVMSAVGSYVIILYYRIPRSAKINPVMSPVRCIYSAIGRSFYNVTISNRNIAHSRCINSIPEISS